MARRTPRFKAAVEGTTGTFSGTTEFGTPGWMKEVWCMCVHAHTCGVHSVPSPKDPSDTHVCWTSTNTMSNDHRSGEPSSAQLRWLLQGELMLPAWSVLSTWDPSLMVFNVFFKASSTGAWPPAPTFGKDTLAVRSQFILST